MVSSYVSKAKFEPSHPSALAVYCSDGRFTESVEELLHALGHDRLDTLTMPGGPALLELNTAQFAALEAVRSATAFLVRGHELKKVVLLAHEGCGFYRSRMAHVEPEAITLRQHEDLRSVAAWLKRTHADVSIDLYYASIENGRVAFALLD